MLILIYGMFLYSAFSMFVNCLECSDAEEHGNKFGDTQEPLRENK